MSSSPDGSSASSCSISGSAPGAAAISLRSTSSVESSTTSSCLNGTREAPAPEVPRVELLQEAGGSPLAELADGFADEEDELRHHLLAARLGCVAVHDLPQRPWVALRAPADHDCGRSRRREHGLRAGARGDVTRGDHRDIDERDELCSEAVIGAAGVHLLRRARVQGENRGACGNELRADGEAVAGAVAEAAAHLHRNGQVDRVGDRRDDAAGEHRVVEQRRTRTGLRHLAHRAAEVDVDDVRACVFDHSRRFRHRVGIGAEDLDRQGMLVGGDTEVAEGLLVAVLDSRTRDHLGADEPRTEAASLTAECLHADARHRRENESSRHLDRVDEPAFPEVDLHHVMVDGCSLRAGGVGSYPSRPS